MLSTYPQEGAFQQMGSRNQSRRTVQSEQTIELMVASILKNFDIYQVIIDLASKYMLE